MTAEKFTEHDETTTEAASTAPEFTFSPVDQLRRDAADTTNMAVHQGRQDVQAAMGVGQSYLEQARSVAASALAKTQEYVQAGRANLQGTFTEEQTGGVTNAIREAASTALAATASTLSSAQSTLSSTVSRATQSRLETAKNTAQPRIQNAEETSPSHVQPAKDILGSHVRSAEDIVRPHVGTPASMAAMPCIDAAAEETQPFVSTSQERSGATQSNTTIDTNITSLETGEKVADGQNPGIRSDS